MFSLFFILQNFTSGSITVCKRFTLTNGRSQGAGMHSNRTRCAWIIIVECAITSNLMAKKDQCSPCKFY